MSDVAAVDPAQFRRALGQFATGVTVITVQQGEVMHGMTANTFTAVSLEPPLVLFCVAKRARMSALLEAADGFAVNFLSVDQERLSRHFAGASQPGSPESVELLRRGPVAPLIPGALLGLSCALEKIHEGGDHWIVVGRVLEIHEPAGATRPPMVFFRSRYRYLTDLPGAEVNEREAWATDAIRIYHDEWSSGEGEFPADEYIRAQIWQ
jgi:3-hydroxy-9,10-secoandrosta-1,3,5(10)-triene-9,17-dione monooxygenase reductase component